MKGVTSKIALRATGRLSVVIIWLFWVFTEGKGKTKSDLEGIGNKKDSAPSRSCLMGARKHWYTSHLRAMIM